MKFRKKPVVIEAIQFTGYSSFAQMMNTWMGPFDSVVDGNGDKENFFIETLEGDPCVTRGDWVIKGIKGEFYPCKSDIFEMTYEACETGFQPAGEKK